MKYFVSDSGLILECQVGAEVTDIPVEFQKEKFYRILLRHENGTFQMDEASGFIAPLRCVFDSPILAYRYAREQMLSVGWIAFHRATKDMQKRIEDCFDELVVNKLDKRTTE